MPSRGTRGTAKKSTTKPPRRCGSCKACTAPDCRKCVYCLDMKKYGGPGTKKQRCMKRPTCFGLQSDERMSSLPAVVSASRVTSPPSKVTNERVLAVSSSKMSKNSSLTSSSPVTNKKRTQGAQKLSQSISLLQSRSPISAARKHL